MRVGLIIYLFGGLVFLGCNSKEEKEDSKSVQEAIPTVEARGIGYKWEGQYKCVEIDRSRGIFDASTIENKKFKMIDVGGYRFIWEQNCIVNSYRELDSIVVNNYELFLHNDTFPKIKLPQINFSELTLIGAAYSQGYEGNPIAYELHVDTLNSKYVFKMIFPKLNLPKGAPSGEGTALPILTQWFVIDKLPKGYDVEFKQERKK